MRMSTDDDLIMLGHDVFKLMDSCGLPLEIITEQCREKDMYFNVYEFIVSAYKSKNYSIDRLKVILKECVVKNEFQEKLIDRFVDHVYLKEVPAL